MFQNAIEKCPGELWDDERQFWYITFHTLWWTDLYLSADPVNFKPPEPYNLDELDPAGVLPPRTYTKQEMLDYLVYCRNKLKELLNDTRFFELRWKNEWRDFSMFEMELYNMRHVQHHTGQLNKMLSSIDPALPNWVSRTKA